MLNLRQGNGALAEARKKIVQGVDRRYLVVYNLFWQKSEALQENFNAKSFHTDEMQ